MQIYSDPTQPEISAERRRLADHVKRSVRLEFGLNPLSLFSERVVEALIDAHVLRVVATWESPITPEKIQELRTDARAVVMFNL